VLREILPSQSGGVLLPELHGVGRQASFGVGGSESCRIIDSFARGGNAAFDGRVYVGGVQEQYSACLRDCKREAKRIL
jgi:hypothetical protein